MSRLVKEYEKIRYSLVNILGCQLALCCSIVRLEANHEAGEEPAYQHSSVGTEECSAKVGAYQREQVACIDYCRVQVNNHNSCRAERRI